MLWEVDIYAAEGQPDRVGRRLAADAADLGLAGMHVAAGYGYLIEGDLGEADVKRLAAELLSDRIVERTVVAPAGDRVLSQSPNGHAKLVHVLPKPGVMDPVAQSAQAAIADFQLHAHAVRTFRKYWLSGIADSKLGTLCGKLLANDAIEQVVVGPLTLKQLDVGSAYQFELVTVPLRDLDDDALMRLSR
jgi:phosphoribosylformylglycinamidine synthase